MDLPKKLTDLIEVEESKKTLALLELVACVGVIAKEFPHTVPGDMAAICLSEVNTKLTGEKLGFILYNGELHTEYRRLSEVLAALEPRPAPWKRPRSTSLQPGSRTRGAV